MAEGEIEVEDEEVDLEQYELRLRISDKRRRVAAVAPASLKAELNRVGIYLAKRHLRKYPKLGMTSASWGMDVDPHSISPHVTLRFNWVDLGPYAPDREGPFITPLPDMKITLRIPVKKNRAERRAGK